ncbi:hypothetical protein Q7P37_010355 [Cladosporium fusiforme]
MPDQDSQPASKPGTPPPQAPPTTNPSSAPPTTNGDNTTSSPFQLQIAKLHALPSEQQDLYLLTFTADLAKHTESLTADGATAEQTALKAELFQIINLASPAPTRVIRNNLGRCFHHILSKGSRKILYESINDCVAILTAGKEKDLKTKHAAAHCLGAIFEAAGDSAVSLSPLACTALIKQLKPAASDTGYRSAIFRALGKTVKGIVAAIEDDVGRTIWKQARNAVNGDKSMLVQASACWCLEQLVMHASGYDNSNDFEKLQVAIWRAMESTSVSVRRAATSCLTAVLVKSYSESPNKDAVPRIKKPKKTKKAKPDDGEEEAERTSSPAPEKPATALSYSLVEILRLLSTHYMRSTTSNKARTALVNTYSSVLKTLGESVVERNYGEVAQHLFRDVLNHGSLPFNRYRLLISRKFVSIILERVVMRMLGETAQLNACRFLLNEVIKDYPQTVKERPEPTKHALTAAVSALTSLIQCLDAGIGSIAELCREALLQVLPHPSFALQIHTARALRALVLAIPQQLLPTVTICLNSVNRELNLLGNPQQSPKRCIGYAHGLAAILSASNKHPLYGSVEVYARVLSQATALLKSAGSSDLRVSSCQLEVAWVMIGGLMSLGPNFVKIHLSQLMLLWKNALPKPVPKENISQRSMLELSYLTHVRECALGSIKSFLTFNQRLLTSDVSRRLSAMLENTVSFLQGLPWKRTSDDPQHRLSPLFQLQDYECNARRRVFQCFSQLLTLSPPGAIEATAHSSLLPLAVASFSGADYYSPSSFGAAIASSAGAYDSIWDAADNYGFGVNGLVSGLDVEDAVTRKKTRHWTSRTDEEGTIADVVATPIVSAVEFDSTCCYMTIGDDTEPLPVSPATEAVNAAIAVFALALPLQAPKVQESMLEQISSSLSSTALNKDPARKTAISTNVTTALYSTLRVATGESGSYKGSLSSTQAENALQSLLRTSIKTPDQSVRFMAADAIGRLCNASGSAFTTGEVTYLTETVVNNREPHVRAGCALALASIHSHLGGMAAGFHMRNIVGILMSLAADTHPLVHFWALESLAQVAESAGLNFSSYVTSSIGMLSQLYVSDSHSSESAVLASSNTSMDLPVAAAVAQGVESLINVLGPDLQDMAKQRDMILTLVRLFSQEEETAILLASLRCLDHLSLYAPGHLEFVEYVQRLQGDMDSTSTEISNAAVQGLFGLMRRDAPEIARAARPGLEDRLWEYLNDEPSTVAIRNIFLNWLQQTGASDPSEWIARCNTILTKTKSRSEQPKTATTKDTAGPDLQDEEVAGFAVTEGAAKEDEGPASSTQELMRWQVRLFAMECLHTLIAMISKEAAISEDSPGEAALQMKVADIVRIAFSASTASVPALRVIGLRIVEQILKMFGRTPDPDFSEAMLLEQYQAQISSALTPAFAADSSPELAAEAVDVCGTFISTGIVTDVERMGRILKLLVSALDSFSQQSETASIGDLQGLSSNAQVMVRMSVFSAWAELQVASGEQQYLDDVVKPHIGRLVPMWLSSLKEYARLRFEPDISATAAAPEEDLDTIYASLNRQTLLRFYQESWLSLVDAIASLIDEDSELVFDALDNKKLDADTQDGEAVEKRQDINYREEPVAFFFVLFGLVFESLAVRSNDDDIVTRQRNLDILQALKKILRPSVSGNAIYQEVIFAESMDLFDRMVLTESLGVQAIIVEIARNLCIAHPSSRHGISTPEQNDGHLSEDIEQLFELTRIIVLVLAGLVPGLSDSPVSVRLESNEEAQALVRSSLQALVDVSDVFPNIIKTDLHATILNIFVTILGTAAAQSVVVPTSLPILRRFVANITTEHSAASSSSSTTNLLRNSLSRILGIMRIAQRRETDASLPCEKNSLLACTILISTAGKDVFSESDPLLNKFTTELIECLESRMTSRISPPRRFLAHAVKFLSDPMDFEGARESRDIMAQSLTAYIPKVTEAGSARPPLTALILTTLLRRAEQEGETVYQETAARVLEVAAVDGVVFRGVVASLPPQEKGLMERVLKARAGAQVKQDVGGEGGPSIALKFNF